MKTYIEERCVRIAEYIVESGATVRQAAAKFGVSKSTVHKDITVRLESVNYRLYLDCRGVLNHNREVRHLRGGEATRRKFAIGK